MQKRYEAECDPAVNVSGELDHLGLYLENVNYVRFVRAIKQEKGSEVRSWPGYRRVVDQYFFQLTAQPEAAEKPRPQVGPRLGEVLACLDREGLPNRCHCAAVLLDMPRASRNDFEEGLEKTLQRNLEHGRPLAFHIQGESSITVFCETPGIQTLHPAGMREYTLAWMTRARVATRLLLSIRFDEQGRVAGVRWEHLRLDDIPLEQQGRIRVKADAQARRRIRTHLEEHGQIGRNELCPCGSGRKYKRCCGRSGS